MIGVCVGVYLHKGILEQVVTHFLGEPATDEIAVYGRFVGMHEFFKGVGVALLMLDHQLGLLIW